MQRLHSLTVRLVLTIVGIVLVVTMLVGATATFAVRAYLTDQLDAQVTAALQRAQEAPAFTGTDSGVTPDPDGDDFGGRGDGEGRGDIQDRRGQGVGTLTAVWPAGSDTGYGEVITQERGGNTITPELSDGALATVAALPKDGLAHSVRLDGIGEYRVAIADDSRGTVAAGLPTTDMSEVVTKLVAWETGLNLVGAGLGALVGLLLVRRQLRPLRQVAATAHTVAELPLGEGDIDLQQRVPDALTDERTEVGQVGAALNTLLAHVETSLQARHRSEQQIRQFVGDASHELRTPLATIVGYVELASRRPEDNHTVRTALAKVNEESRRMTALVEDLLLLARLDSGRPLERRPVDLTRLLVEAVSDARVLAPEHRWRLVVPEEVVEVPGDEQRLHQVITNLLTNARKYTPQGTTVTVTARTDGFVVHDDGPGFPPQVLSTAFERFARADSARNRAGGAGLGLALVDAIVAAHGGSVDLQSRPGSTTLSIALPAS
jgi:two-component system, OmpR family, sensor kinase